MAVSLRLMRRGATHRPFYHVVAADSRAPRDGKFIEKLGYYDPTTEPSTIQLNEERVQYWFGVGAQMSSTVGNLVKIKKLQLKRKIHSTVKS